MLLGIVLAVFGSVFVGTKVSNASWTPGLALDLEGGTQLILTPVSSAGTPTSEDISQAISVIRQRVDASGVSEAEISRQGQRNIVVSLPGTPSQETLDLVRKSSQMDFRPVLAVDVGSPAPQPTATPTATPTDGATSGATPGATPSASASATADGAVAGTVPGATTPAPQPSPSATSGATSPSDAAYYLTPEVQKQFEDLDCSAEGALAGGEPGAADKAFVTCDTDGVYKYALGPIEIPGTQIDSATSGLQVLPNGGVGTEWVVNIKFTNAGTTTFAKTTERLLAQQPPQNQFAMVLDGLVISAPQVNTVIPNGQAEISGDFTQASAATLAQQLNFGSLPLTFQVESEQRVSATLGSEQLQAGLVAGLIGLVLVVIYSFLQYRALAVLTVGSLVVAGVLTYGVIALLSWTQGYRLSLPGVAGLIIAIGITADSFIVYFERIRDELRDGRTLPAAVERGWDRARRTILASDAVNLLAAVVLYALSVGGVRGFAFTLGLTTVIDVVVVFLFTHPMMEIIARTRFWGGGHPLSGLDPRRLGAPESTRYVGRGKVVTGPRSTKGPEDAVEDAPATDRKVPAPVGSGGMTIAERRAAERAAARRADAPADAPQTTEGND